MAIVVERQKHVIDAAGQTPGRLATQLVTLLRGKHKTSWKTHVDMGDFVEVINVEKMVFTGNKVETKVYRHHTGQPGGLREEALSTRLSKGRKGYEAVVKNAVKGMLPTNSFRNEAMKRLTFRYEESK
jgi:large subunit ribosomal protein L13